ncbi:MAG: hypothetical protein HQL06_10175 [Nitrospirae bacterium]|nr:hypothetical protein [Nitrospirota bacterium]
MTRPKCKICNHAERAKIESEILAGVSLREIAKSYGFSRMAPSTHKPHMGVSFQEAIVKQEERRNLSVYDSILALHDKTLLILNRAEQEGDLRTCLLAVSEARRNLELISKLTGELKDNTVNILINPEFQQVSVAIFNALEAYPQARLAVSEVLSAD